MMRITLLRRLALAGLLLAFCVVVFGAYVRLTDAGLGCPDWPGCYGHVTPAARSGGRSRHRGRAAARRQGLARDDPPLRGVDPRAAHPRDRGLRAALAPVCRTCPWRCRSCSCVLVIFQGMLGMLTVTWLLKPLIVTAHLVFGLHDAVAAVVAVADAAASLDRTLVRQRVGRGWWSDRRDAAARAAGCCGAWRSVALVRAGDPDPAGGWTSTNYAAVACPDFPQCQAPWWPEAEFARGFDPWHGLGINYEGGVLDHPARVAIHFTHRLGAIVATLALLFAAV